MARELNDKAKKAKESSILGFVNERNEKLKAKIDYILNERKFGLRPVKNWLKKLQLLEEQNYKDAYDGERLDWKKYNRTNKNRYWPHNSL